MVKRLGSFQRKTRHKIRAKTYREKGKLSVSRYFQKFEEGEKVGLKICAQVQKGRFHARFHGLTGTVNGKKGACYAVEIHDMNKKKTLYVHPIHLKKLS